MAVPKVFVSSTCYDLQEERAQLERFISGYGFQPVLSEYSGVFYDPDEHTHDACVKEVNHCDLFVLIISGRFGGKLKDGKGESITQAEYNEARKLGIPVFAFVKADVLAAQFYYKENLRSHDEAFAKKINYPAIEKQEDASSIFSFIQQVQRSQTNNAIEQYQSFTEIENHLKKQWAGMFFSFLQKRKEQDKVASMSSAIDKLIGSTSTLESLVESLHNKNVGEKETQTVIETSEIRAACIQFFNLLKKYSEIGPDPLTLELNHLSFTIEDIKENANIHPGNLLENYIDRLGIFSFKYIDKDNILVGFKSTTCATYLNGETYIRIAKLFDNGIKKSSPALRRDALEEVFVEYIVQD